MASTVTSGSLVYERRVVERVHKYHWPAVQLNIWMLIMLVASCLIIGVFSTFIQIQQVLLLPIPWYAPCLPPPSFVSPRSLSPPLRPYANH
jgi:arginase